MSTSMTPSLMYLHEYTDGTNWHNNNTYNTNRLHNNLLNLSAMGDVNITGLADNDAIKWDEATQKYVNFEHSALTTTTTTTTTVAPPTTTTIAPATTTTVAPATTTTSTSTTTTSTTEAPPATMIFNSADKSAQITLSLADTRATSGDNNDKSVRGFGIKYTGKFYFEYRFYATVANTNEYGILDPTSDIEDRIGVYATGWSYDGNNGNVWNNNSASAYGTSIPNNYTIGVAVDLDDGKIFYSRNGVWQGSGDPVAGTNPAHSNVVGPVLPALSLQIVVNAVDIRGTAADCLYAIPTGYTYWDASDQVAASTTTTTTTTTVAPATTTTSTTTSTTTTTTSTTTTTTTVAPATTTTTTVGYTGMTWDSANMANNMRLKNGDLTLWGDERTENDWRQAMATVGKSTGKWYWEAHIDAEGGGTNWMTHGVQNGLESLESYVGDSTSGWGFMGQGRQYNGAAIETGVFYTAGDIIGVAVDVDNGKIWWAKNNTWVGASGLNPDPATGVDAAYSNLTGTIYPAGSIYYGATDEVTGKFTAAQQTYTAPSGFTAWGD